MSQNSDKTAPSPKPGGASSLSARGAQLLRHSLIRYAISGGTAVGITLVLLFVFVDVFGFAEIVGSVLAFCIGHVANYLMQYYFTFRSTVSHASTFTRFMLFSVITITLNFLLFSLLTTQVHYLAAQAITLVVIFLVNYGLNRRFTFKQK